MNQADYFLSKSIKSFVDQDYFNAENYLYQVLKIQPKNIDALRLLGVCAAIQKRSSIAIKYFEKVIKLAPNYAIVHSNLGNVFQDLGKYDKAITAYNQAILIDPNYAEARNNLGNTLQKIGQYTEALVAYDLALSIDPSYAEAFSNRGNALYELGRYREAIESYSSSVFLDPSNADAYKGRAISSQEIGNVEDAIRDFNVAINLGLNDVVTYGLCHQAKLSLCEWTEFEVELNKLKETILVKNSTPPPFLVLTAIDSLEIQKKSAQLWSESRHPPLNKNIGLSKKIKKQKICIGYFSADFHNHATTHLMAEFFELHDRHRFEIIAFSFGPEIQDDMRARLVPYFDKFLDVRLNSDKEISEMAQFLGVDIAVDLKGFTNRSRPGIFSYRASPIQVSYLGYPGTMGALYMDYLIADPILIPEQSRYGYVEKIAYLPDTYQPNDSKRLISNVHLTRRQFGLPENAFVFCCFNSLYKITPDIFHSWMRILEQVPNSVLWLLSVSDISIANLKKEAQKRGIEDSRLIFSDKLPSPEHLARHQLADLFLDTFPCNAHTTASDSLWSGLPLLTMMGESFVARVAGSLLSAVNLSELIANDIDDYVRKAIYFANSPKELNLIKSKLNESRFQSALFNTPIMVRNIENLYVQMYQKYKDDLPPDHLWVNHALN